MSTRPQPWPTLSAPMPPDTVAVRRAADAVTFAQAALVLGEQRAWTARLGVDLDARRPEAPWEHACLQRFYGAPEGALFVARIDGEPVGVVGVRRRGAAEGELRRLYVRPSGRGRGVGRPLVLAAVEGARRLGLGRLRVEIAPTLMPAAFALYRALGFVATPPRGPHGVDGVIGMQLGLGAPSRAIAAAAAR